MTDPIKQALEAMRDGLSACQTVSMSRDRRITRDGCVSYLQTEEWCRWLEYEVAPKIRAAIAALEGLEKAEPVLVYHGRCVIDCGDNGHHDVELLRMIPKGTKLFTHPAPVQAEPGWCMVPDLASTVVNDAAWKFVEAMPHKLPGPIWNDLKPALYAALCYYHVEVLKHYSQPTAAQVVGLTDAQIEAWWQSENGLEDCQLSKRLDFFQAVRTFEERYGINPPEAKS